MQAGALRPANVAATYAMVRASIHDVASGGAKVGSYSAVPSAAISHYGEHYAGDAKFAESHPNAVCVTSNVGNNSILALCDRAHAQQQNPTSACAWKGSYALVTDQIPPGGLKTCDKVSDPSVPCLPPGTVAISCNPDAVGMNAFGGDAQLLPFVIAVPKSEADHLMSAYGSCYSGNATSSGRDAGAYVRTSDFQVAFSKPFGAPM